ncbi:hypothetical protein MHZ92_20010 [Sporosarcina sp. ACRSL]|uniref:hypothetical protein n=1 Tax=Sporosarcina sp. ACRSL TaxID=2918215 RepID=UPI001EF62EC4|nr:hypothetical protein [Sporosarcina sp. ACRSL]MCG7346394.1 hypothetical protein [Sporosarcina sp. ACRSL]
MTTTKNSTQSIDYSTYPRLKAFHAVQYGEGFQQRNYSVLESYANVDDVTLKRAPRTTLEGAARDMITAVERAEQIAIRANPPVNCKGYVERADYPITSLYSDYKEGIEAEERTWADYRAERKKWRKCKHMYCLNVFPTVKDNFKLFPAKRKGARYCCDGCRVAHKDAHKRYEATGSYLPVYYYLPKLTESVNDEARMYESAYEADKIEKQVDKKRPQRRVVVRKVNDKGTSGGVVTTYKTRAEAVAAYDDVEREGWVKIN